MKNKENLKEIVSIAHQLRFYALFYCRFIVGSRLLYFTPSRLFDRVKFLSDENRYQVSSSDGMALRLTWNAFIAGEFLCIRLLLQLYSFMILDCLIV